MRTHPPDELGGILRRIPVGRSLPVIGISCSLGQKEQGGPYQDRFYLNADYARAVGAAGGIPIILPHWDTRGWAARSVEPQPESGLLRDEVLGHILDTINGLLLSGGGDVSPERFGYLQHGVNRARNIDLERDDFEISLVKAARARRMPIFAICRGIQVLNVAFGGTLIQDIPSQMGERVPHNGEGYRGRSEVAHEVEVKSGTRLRDIIGGLPTLGVNSFHHQAVDQVGEGLRIAAVSPEDGVIEALETMDDSFCLGVQWHPECMTPEDEPSRRTFRAFVEAAAGF